MLTAKILLSTAWLRVHTRLYDAAFIKSALPYLALCTHAPTRSFLCALYRFYNDAFIDFSLLAYIHALLLKEAVFRAKINDNNDNGDGRCVAD